MEKKQYELCREILRRFDDAGLLEDLVLIGSWCVFFYEDYFKGTAYVKSFTTRDLDLLVPHPQRIKTRVDVPHLLEDLGFVVDLYGSQGYIRLNHPDLILEFLTQEKGRGTDKPYPLPKLGLNAVALRFLNVLLDHTICVQAEGFELTLPHPANFALHKLMIAQRRTNREKALKDITMAREILSALIKKGDQGVVRHVFDSFIPSWQKKVLDGLHPVEDEAVLQILKAKGKRS